MDLRTLAQAKQIPLASPNERCSALHLQSITIDKRDYGSLPIYGEFANTCHIPGRLIAPRLKTHSER